MAQSATDSEHAPALPPNVPTCPTFGTSVDLNHYRSSSVKSSRSAHSWPCGRNGGRHRATERQHANGRQCCRSGTDPLGDPAGLEDRPVTEVFPLEHPSARAVGHDEFVDVRPRGSTSGRSRCSRSALRAFSRRPVTYSLRVMARPSATFLGGRGRASLRATRCVAVQSDPGRG